MYTEWKILRDGRAHYITNDFCMGNQAHNLFIQSKYRVLHSTRNSDSFHLFNNNEDSLAKFSTDADILYGATDRITMHSHCFFSFFIAFCTKQSISLLNVSLKSSLFLNL